jgi:hypothetical protein
MNLPKKDFRCTDPSCNHGRGNILFILHTDQLFIRRRNPEGNYWERFTIKIPGIKNVFEDAAFSQKVLSENFKRKRRPWFEGSKIFVQCRNSSCQRWSSVEVKVPGLAINLADAAIVRDDMPVDYNLHIAPAPRVVI